MLSLNLGLFLYFVQWLLDVESLKQARVSMAEHFLTYYIRVGLLWLAILLGQQHLQACFKSDHFQKGKESISPHKLFMYFLNTQGLTPRKLSSSQKNTILRLGFIKVKIFWTTLHRCPYRYVHPPPFEVLEATPPHLHLSLHKRSLFHSFCLSSASLVEMSWIPGVSQRERDFSVYANKLGSEKQGGLFPFSLRHLCLS